MERFNRASYQLVFNKELKITDIVFTAQYETHESFTRAFKKIFGLTPSQYTFPKTLIAVLEYQGSPQLLNEAILLFIA